MKIKILLLSALVFMSSFYVNSQTHLGSSTLGSVLIAPNNISANHDSELNLGEDHDGTYGMKLFYDGGENKFKIFGKNTTNLRGPHFIMDREDGKIGLGIVDPEAQLHIGGEAMVIFERPDYGDGLLKAVMGISSNGGPIGLRMSVCPDGNTSNAIDILHLASTGNVGIGTVDPTSKLTVNGEIKCERVRVISDVPYADYVFSNDYKLKSLEEFEVFIEQNNHLPNVPSAETFAKEGYSIGEMDNLLLEKIEEQALYILQLNERLEQLESILLKISE